MESDVTQSDLIYKLWAWADKNRKQLIWGVIALVVLGLIIAFVLTHKSEAQNDANDALSKLTSRQMVPSAAPATADDFLRVANDFSGTAAGQRARLLAATDLFASGKYDDAQAQFQKFVQEYPDSPFIAQAALGSAASYDALGKTNDAVTAYQSVIDRFGSQSVAPQAKLAQARLFEAQGKFKEARTAYEDLARTLQGTTIGSEAIARFQALNAAHPELQPAPPATPAAPPASKAVPAPGINLKQP